SASFTKLATSLFFLAVTMIEFRLVYGVQLVRGNVALLLLIMLLVIPSIYGIGLAFGSLVIRFKEANAMVFLVRGIFMIFCGITYPLEVLPEWMQSVADWLPLTHAIQGIREVVLAGATAAEILPTLQRLVLFAVVLPLLGYVTFQFTERTARRSGSLGQY
ncbi:MAG TPA: ABC transporter permease, partial [Ardenticatenaceae bacterium]|nr:ABC transporter permease [Ardenticatenaceae bacterium]